MSASKIKLEWRSVSGATPLKTKYCLHRGLFVLSAQFGAVHLPSGFFTASPSRGGAQRARWPEGLIVMAA